MTRVVIENPILNSPFREPEQHFRFSDEGITQDIAEGRRRSTYFVPIPPPKKMSAGQLVLGAEFARERAQDNDFINRVREQVNAWRTTRYPGVTMRKASPNRASCGLASLFSDCQAMSIAMTTVLPEPVAILNAIR